MPVNKSAFIRYRIIDACLSNPMRRYPKQQDILDRIEQQLGTGISSSQFNKDIQQMKLLFNAPIRYYRARGGYGYEEENFSIREFPLTHDEIQALDYSTALLHQLKGTRMFQHFENAINKVIEGYRLSGILGKSETQILQVEEPVRTEGSRWLEPLLSAIVEKTLLNIIYQGFGREEKEHPFSPYLLKEYRNRWYVIGHSARADKILVLALDRILGLNPAKGSFHQDGSFSPEQFFRYALGITVGEHTEPMQVILQFSARQAPYILSQPLHHSQEIIRHDADGLRISLDVYNSPELRMTILSYGPECTVLEPDGLKEEIRGMVRGMGV